MIRFESKLGKVKPFQVSLNEKFHQQVSLNISGLCLHRIEIEKRFDGQT